MNTIHRLAIIEWPPGHRETRRTPHSVLVSDKVSDRERRTNDALERRSRFAKRRCVVSAVRARELCEFPAISIRILKTRGTELKIVRCIGPKINETFHKLSPMNYPRFFVRWPLLSNEVSHKWARRASKDARGATSLEFRRGLAHDGGVPGNPCGAPSPGGQKSHRRG